MSIRRHTCIHCGSTNATIKIGTGEYICSDCAEKYYETCPDCGKLYQKEQAVIITEVRPTSENTTGTRRVCPSCSGKYTYCGICGFKEHYDRMLHVEGITKYICKKHIEEMPDFFVAYQKDEHSTIKYYRASDCVEYYRIDGSRGKIPRSIVSSIRRSIPDKLIRQLTPTTSDNRMQTIVCDPETPKAIIQCQQSGDFFEIGPGSLFYYFFSEGTLQWASPHYVENHFLCDCGHFTDRAIGYFTIPETNHHGEIDIDGCLPTRSETSDDHEIPQENGNTLCPHCASNFMNQVSEGSTVCSIFGHSFTPNKLEFHSLSEEDKGPMMGLELEVDQGRNPSKVAAQILKEVGRKHLYIKRDGSLTDGQSFEQVTHPATIDYYLKERERYEKMLDIPRANGYKSHDARTCGLHVHVDRKFIGTDKTSLKKIIYLSEKLFPEIFIFSRRDSGSQQQWAKCWLDPMSTLLGSEKDAEETLDQKFSDGDRYKLVNIQREPTVEFRIFRGTLNKITFWATLELVNNLSHIAKENTLESLDNIKWLDVINYRHFPELDAYVEKRLGKGWAGQKRFRTMDIADSSEGSYSVVEIPGIKDLSKIKLSRSYLFKADNDILLATWPMLQEIIKEHPELIAIDYERRGDFIELITDSSLQSIKLDRGEFKIPELGEDYKISWIICEAKLLNQLPEETKNALISASAKSYNTFRMED